EERFLIDQIDDRLGVRTQFRVPAQVLFDGRRLATLPGGALLVQQAGRQPPEGLSRSRALTHGRPPQDPRPGSRARRPAPAACVTLPRCPPTARRCRPIPGPPGAAGAGAIRPGRGGGAPSPEAPHPTRAGSDSSRGRPPPTPPPRPRPRAGSRASPP